MLKMTERVKQASIFVGFETKCTDCALKKKSLVFTENELLVKTNNSPECE